LEQVAKKQNKFLKILGWVFSIIFFAVCAVIIFFNLTHEYHTVSGDSMYPTLNGTTETDGVFVSKIKGYGRGDILVVNKGEKDAYGQDIFVVKRLIAIGGDKITIREVDGYFRIILIYNGETEETILNEPYLEDYSNNSSLKAKFEKMIQQKGYILDNGFLQITDGQIFYLGDNRLTSNDSSTYGYKEQNLVVGKVDYIAYGNTNIYWQVIKQAFGW